MNKTGGETNTPWLRLPGMSARPHQHLCFRYNFLGGSVGEGVLRIAADSDFVAWFDGVEIGRGQFSDYPECKSWSRLAFSGIRPGMTHTLAVLVYYRGEDFSDYRAGEFGLFAAVESGAGAGSGRWRCQPHPAFVDIPAQKVTLQQGYCVCFDARRDWPWLESGFDDTAWPEAEKFLIPGRTLMPRPWPAPRPAARTPARIVMQGVFLRREESESAAQCVAADYLRTQPWREVLVPMAEVTPEDAPMFAVTPEMPVGIEPAGDRGSGVFIVVDLQKERSGLLDLELAAPAGTVLDIAYGEHLDDGRVRANPGGRNFADRYICGDGRQRFTLEFRRIGARYIEVHFSGFTTRLILHYCGVLPLVFHPGKQMEFHCSDSLLNRMREVASDTLQLCMYDHFEDSPWREHALYAHDGRLQALFGYYLWGNYEFAAASLALLGQGIRADGLLELCAPARVAITIPSFSLLWIDAVKDHWLYSGSPALFRRFEVQIERMLAVFLSRQEPATGLYAHPEGKELWHFYEWSPDMAGFAQATPMAEAEFHAPFNLLLAKALHGYAQMLEWDGKDSRAAAYETRFRRLAAAIAAGFALADGSLASYRRYGVPVLRHSWTQALAAAVLPVTETERNTLFEASSAPAVRPATLSSTLELVEGFMAGSPEARAAVSACLRARWTPMLFQGATSFRETAVGAADFDGAGSMCHGWSALPAYFAHAWILGVRPLAPGFARFAVSPYPENCHHASGAVATPHGPIWVHWRRTDAGLAVEVRHPAACVPELHEFPEVGEYVWNSKRSIETEDSSSSKGN